MKRWDLLWILGAIGFILFVTPLKYVGIEPATGGDTHSHFQALFDFYNYGMVQHRMRVWNPGNLLGEPLMIHYFPGPYLLMSFLVLLVPVGLAFNIGTLLPIFVFPLSVYYAARKLELSTWTRALWVALSMLFMFNENYSMWGGNTNSLLAGQFAHLYALCFYFILMGKVAQELREDRLPVGSGIIVSLIAICHAYILILVPPLFLGFVIAKDWKKRLRHLLISGVLGGVLSLWFLFPLVANRGWTNPTPIEWVFTNFWNDFLGKVFAPLPWLIFLSLLVGLFFQLNVHRFFHNLKRPLLIFGIPILTSIGFFYLFPKIGLIDIRALPQIQVFTLLLWGTFLGEIIGASPKNLRPFLTVFVFGLCMGWSYKNIHNHPYWVEWNYKGIRVKEAYPDLRDVVRYVKGDFSQPRILYEHHEDLGKTGSPRVFELLPTYANRATLESLFIESSIGAPIASHMQARVSVHPSCPARGWPCTTIEYKDLKPKLDLAAIGSLILITPESKEKAEATKLFEKKVTTRFWDVYDAKEQPKLVEVLKTVPEVYQPQDLKKELFAWFEEYTGTQNFWFIDPDHKWKPEILDSSEQNCNPRLKVEFNRMELTTDCLYKPHLVKFTFHPNFRTSSGDPLYLITPGFMMLVPSQNNVVISFDTPVSWSVADWISILTAVILVLLWFRQEFKRISEGKKI